METHSDRDRRGREIQREIASILMSDWDPLEVADQPEAEGEYDAYVGPIYRLLASGASAEQVASYLARTEVKMGLTTASAADLLPIAERLSLLDVGVGGEAG